MRSLSLIAVIATLACSAVGQRAVGPAHAPAPHINMNMNLPTGNFALGRSLRMSASRRSSFGRSSSERSSSERSSRHGAPYTSLPFPFFGDGFTGDDGSSSGDAGLGGPPPFLMQALSGLAGSAAGSMGPMGSASREPSSSAPLMIELQNGRYVKVDSAAINGDALPLAPAKATPGVPANRPNTSRPPAIASAVSPSQAPTIAAATPSVALPAAVLIFHDGHSEEVRDYTIADGMLYARGDYYTDGYWNKKIDLAKLDVPETLQANTNRNVKFVLPSSPNEVITRP